MAIVFGVFCFYTANVDLDIDCGDAPASNDATIEYTGKGFERVAHYLCNDGFYVSSGNTARKCTGGGTWDGQLLSCARTEAGFIFIFYAILLD